MKLHIGFEARVLAAFALAVVVVLGLASITWKLERSANDATRWVAHSRLVLDAIGQIKTDTLQIEFSTQSFRISGDPARIIERDASVADREAALNNLVQLTVDNASQQERFVRLRAVIDQRKAISQQVEALRKTQGQDVATAYAAKAPLQATRELTYRLLRDMDDTERQLLDRRMVQQARAREAMVYAGTFAALAMLILLAGTLALVRRQIRATEASRNALAESRESLAITLHSIGDAVVATDTRGCVTRMNPVAEALTGWSAEEAQGRSIEEVFRIIHEFTRESAVVPVTSVLESGEVRELANHTVLIARDGAEHPISDSAAPIRDARGAVVGVVLVFRDVSSQRMAVRVIHEQQDMLERRVRAQTVQLRDSEEHLRSVISSVPAMIAYVDARQHYVYVNRQYQERFASGQPDISGRTVQDVLGSERYSIVAPMIERVLRGEQQSYDWQPFPEVWQAISYVPKRNDQGQVLGYYVLGSDITVRKRSEEKIELLNTELERHVRDLERVSRALRTLSAGNRAMLRATDEQDLLNAMCRAIVEVGGYRMASVWFRIDDAEQSLQVVAEYGHPGGMGALREMKGTWADNPRGLEALATAIRSGTSNVVLAIQTDPRYEPWRTHLPGCSCAAACPLTVNGVIIGALAIYSSEPDSFGGDELVLLAESTDDLAFGIGTLRARLQQKETQDAMYRLSRYDLLTGLPNETLFTERMSAAIVDGQRSDCGFSVLQMNVERLSEINDALGFGYGDDLLRDFGARLSAVAPEPAVVARLRGDEFALLLPNATRNSALVMAQHLESGLAEPFLLADIALEVSARIGIAVFPEHGVTPQDLYRHMDIALHLAKRHGVRHMVFDPAQNQDQSRRLSMAGELRRAIEGGELALYLQPKVDMKSGRVCGAEGLVRWCHAQRGLIMPGEFIGVAEQTGLIQPLTEWVIATALRLGHAWSGAGRKIPIAVNLSARNLRDDGLLEKIRRLQGQWNVAPGLLELEITESTIMDDAEYALHFLNELRGLGIPLYIDDFGTGYSSLSYLQKLPVEYIKIDQSFVRDMSVSKDSAVIVRSTIDLAHDLGRKVVAEGVETRAHWDQLAAFGCNFAQGYFLARPMPADEFLQWMDQFQPPPTVASSP